METMNDRLDNVPAIRRSEEQILLEESVHRTGNEILAALAALRLLKAASGPTTRERLLDQALLRLEGFASVHRLFASRPASSVNAGAELATLCHALAGPSLDDGRTFSLTLPDLWIDGTTARRLLLIAAEVVSNAIRHALPAGGTRIDVALDVADHHAVLRVSDDGPGLRACSATSGTGLGTGIVDELVRLGQGTIERRGGPEGTMIAVALPLDMRALAKVRRRG